MKRIKTMEGITPFSQRRPEVRQFNRSSEMSRNSMDNMQPAQEEQRMMFARKQQYNDTSYYNRSTTDPLHDDVDRRVENALQNTMGHISRPRYGYGQYTHPNDRVDEQEFTERGNEYAQTESRKITNKIKKQQYPGKKNIKPVRTRKQCYNNHDHYNHHEHYNPHEHDDYIERRSGNDMFGGFGNLIDPSGFSSVGGNVDFREKHDINIKPIKRKQRTNRRRGYATDFDINENVTRSMDDTIDKLLF